MVFDDIPGLDQESFLSKLIPSWVSLVTQLAAFIILIIVVIIFAYKPIKRIINKREEYIANEINDAHNKNIEADNNIEKSNLLLSTSKKEANQIIIDAKESALHERNKLIDETNTLIKKMKDDAEAEIEQSKLDAKEDIRKEMVNLAIDASREILKREVNSKDNTRIAEEFIKEVK